MQDRPYTKDSQRYLILLSIILICVAVRIITAEYVDIGGDNSEKWRQAQHLLAGTGYTKWYQQTVRWAIMLPLAGVQKLFGLNPVNAYILPISFASLGTGCLYLIGERLHSRALGITAALLAIVFPQMAQTGSQLWPGVFEFGYLCLTIWLLLCWHDSRSTMTLITAALIFFLGWGSRVTMIYAAPGLALLIWLPTRNFKALVLFFGLLLILFLTEWGAFRLVTGNPMGRIGIIMGTHIQTAGLDISTRDYLLNFTQLLKLKGLIPIWAACFIASLYVTFSGEARFRALALLYLIHAFLLLYMLSSLSPLKLAMPVGTRFWGPIAPLGLLLTLKGLFDLQASWPKTARALIAILFIAFIGFTAKEVPATNSLIQIDHDYAVLHPVLEAKGTVRMEYEHWQPNFIEAFVIAKFTGEKGKRIPREDHVKMAMIRNHARMIALFLDDVALDEQYRDRNLLTQEGYTTFTFTPPDATGSTEPQAEIRFGRKHHMAEPLP